MTIHLVGQTGQDKQINDMRNAMAEQLYFATAKDIYVHAIAHLIELGDFYCRTSKEEHDLQNQMKTFAARSLEAARTFMAEIGVSFSDG